MRKIINGTKTLNFKNSMIPLPPFHTNAVVYFNQYVLLFASW